MSDKVSRYVVIFSVCVGGGGGLSLQLVADQCGIFS